MAELNESLTFVPGSLIFELFGYEFKVIEVGKLIAAKRAAGRPKDLIAIPELEAVQEAQTLRNT